MKLSVGQVLEMPYKNKELSMLIFLPNEMEDGTTGLEKVRHTCVHSLAHTNPKDTDKLINPLLNPLSSAGEGADL